MFFPLLPDVFEVVEELQLLRGERPREPVTEEGLAERLEVRGVVEAAARLAGRAVRRTDRVAPGARHAAEAGDTAAEQAGGVAHRARDAHRPRRHPRRRG